LFKIIATTGGGKSEELLTKLNLSRKEHYSRISKLLKAGLVKKKDGKYTVIALGTIVYGVQLTLEGAVNSYWKLKAIDSVNSSNGISANEFKALIDVLIEYKEMKAILLRNSF
jgi:predicted transcriptional regulator